VIVLNASKSVLEAAQEGNHVSTDAAKRIFARAASASGSKFLSYSMRIGAAEQELRIARDARAMRNIASPFGASLSPRLVLVIGLTLVTRARNPKRRHCLLCGGERCRGGDIRRKRISSRSHMNYAPAHSILLWCNH